MQPGLKLNDNNGNQVAIFPSRQILVTQNPMSPGFTHRGTKAMDVSCHAGKKLLYAPVDMLCYLIPGYGDGGVFFHSVRPVLTPVGLRNLTVYVCHDNNYRQWQVGKVYKQGEHFYTEGTEGFATGVHVHYDVAFTHESSLVQNEYGNWHLRNSVFIDDMFFANYTEVVVPNAAPPNIGNYVLNWRYYEEVIRYLVTFNSNGGSNVASQNIEKGKKAVKPKDPTKEGYIFYDWYYNNRPYNFDTPVNNNLTLIAQWKEIAKNDIIPLYMMDIIKGGYNG